MRSTAERTPTARVTAPVGVAAVAWFVTLVASFVGAVVVVSASGHSGDSLRDVPFPVTAASLAVQWLATIAVLWYVSRHYLSSHPVADYGLRFRPIDVLGVPIGILAQLVLLEILYWPLRSWFPHTFSKDQVEQTARDITHQAHGGWKVVLVVALVVGAPLIEETLYRGLILRSLDARIADLLALFISAVWFAAAHFEGLELLGLFAFGLVVGTCFQRTGRLGMGILAHAAFNATSLVLLW